MKNSHYQLIHPKVHGAVLNVKVKKPQRYLNNAQGIALANMFRAAKARRKKIVHSPHCVVVFFHKKRGGGLVAVQRCDNRHTFKSPSFRAAAKRRAAQLCRNKKHQFKRCR